MNPATARLQQQAAQRRSARQGTTKHMPGHVLTPYQVQQLVMPIHVAIELLPLGLFGEKHGHDLAAFLNVAQIAARDAKRSDIHDIASDGAEVLLAMRKRVNAGKSWNVTTDERDRLTRCVMTLDRWYRTQSSARWKRALYAVLRICDRAMADGKEEMDILEINQCA